MIYSQIYLQKKTSKLLVVVACLVAALSFFVAFSQHKPVIAPSVLKENLVAYDIANPTSTQTSIFWQTSKSEVGWVEFGTSRDSFPSKASDDRDLVSDPQSYVFHIATLDNLTEDTDYYYRFMTSKGIYKVAGQTVFHFRTPKKNLQISNAKPAYGKILLPNGNPKENVIVLLRIENFYPLVALSKQTGEWLIPLNGLISRQTAKNTPDIAATSKAQLDFYYEDGKKAHVSTLLSNITPLTQTILLGHDYTMLAKSTVLGSSTTSSAPQEDAAFTVVYPRENGLIPSARPLFKGTGVPGADVFVFINSKPQFAYRTNVDSKGEWRVQPTQDIGAGNYTAAITSKNEKGAKITVNRNFIIAKDGEQVLGVATGEPTLAPSPTSAVLPTAAVSPTTGPTSQPTPTVIYNQPTAVPTQPVYNQPTVTPQPPRSGSNFSYMLFVAVGFLVTGGGLMLVF